MDALKLALQAASDGQISIRVDGIKSWDRKGGVTQFYLAIELAEPIELQKLKYRRFQANLRINGRFHPLSFFVYNSTSIELEKWDEREFLPDDESYVGITLEDTEGF